MIRNIQKNKRYRAIMVNYKPYHRSTKCFYCGDKGDSIDHVPSLYEVYTRGVDFFLNKNIQLITVNSCRQCNSVAGTKGHNTDQRAKIIYKRYNKMYQSVLNNTFWSEEELDELGFLLRSAIEDKNTIKGWVERRLQYMEDIFYDVL